MPQWHLRGVLLLLLVLAGSIAQLADSSASSTAALLHEVPLVDTSIAPEECQMEPASLRQACHLPVNAADAAIAIPEQLVKVTDRRHRFPIFATICSMAFLGTIVVIIMVCS